MDEMAGVGEDLELVFPWRSEEVRMGWVGLGGGLWVEIRGWRRRRLVEVGAVG